MATRLSAEMEMEVEVDDILSSTSSSSLSPFSFASPFQPPLSSSCPTTSLPAESSLSPSTNYHHSISYSTPSSPSNCSRLRSRRNATTIIQFQQDAQFLLPLSHHDNDDDFPDISESNNQDSPVSDHSVQSLPNSPLLFSFNTPNVSPSFPQATNKRRLMEQYGHEHFDNEISPSIKISRISRNNSDHSSFSLRSTAIRFPPPLSFSQSSPSPSIHMQNHSSNSVLSLVLPSNIPSLNLTKSNFGTESFRFGWKSFEMHIFH